MKKATKSKQAVAKTKKPAAKAKAVAKKKAVAPAKPAAKPAAKPVAKAKPVVKAKPGKVAKPAKAKPTPPPAAEPVEAPTTIKLSKERVAQFQKLLLDLRDHLIDGVSFLASENLKRSQRDTSGELSGYSLHMADAGTDNFDREFALSLVSSEQEALYEIEEAIKRLEHGEYGVCQMCDKPIVFERLEAVPFARLCVHCQSGIERDRRGQFVRSGPTFTESADDESDGDDGED